MKNLLKKAKRAGNAWKHLSAVAASVLLAWACLGISAHSLAAAHSPTEQFEGTWKAVHDGTVFIVLQLRAENGYPSGTVQLAGFQLDLQGTGALVSVTDEDLDTPIKLQNVKVTDNKTLSFDFVDNDGDDDKWTMELTGTNTANFLWVGLPKGLKAKPIVLTREAKAGNQGFKKETPKRPLSLAHPSPL